ncbi:hypothetical protein JHK85_007444 [Glycine max]|nr:hypothetical protein JHK85_007444 [Glycine max]KAG5072021.1 hypothetical protein JHK86_007232 [Glycine max]
MKELYSPQSPKLTFHIPLLDFLFCSNIDETMKHFQKKLTELEVEAEHLLLARHLLVENDRLRNGNGNREALTALRKRAWTTKSSVASPFESAQDFWCKRFAPPVANMTLLSRYQTQLDFEAKRLQSVVKEKSYLISEAGVLADKISPGVLKSLVTLNDKPN